MRILENIKLRWNNYLAKLAAANERSFGDQKLDCCALNRPTTTSKTASLSDKNSEPHA